MGYRAPAHPVREAAPADDIVVLFRSYRSLRSAELHARLTTLFMRLVSLDEEREGDDGAPIAQRDRITTKHAAGSMPVEDRVLIADAIERLSGLQRKVIYYLFYMDLTQTEAAHKLGISQKHVSRVMHAALRRLRETLHPEAV